MTVFGQGVVMASFRKRGELQWQARVSRKDFYVAKQALKVVYESQVDSVSICCPSVGSSALPSVR